MSGEHPTAEGRCPATHPTGEDTKGTTRRKARRAWKPAFLRALRVTGNVSAACKAARVGRRRAYTCYHTQPEFRRAWEAAIEEATDALEAEARRRAVDGVPTPVFHAGVQVGTVTRYSDALLVRLLQAYRPERFADRRRGEAVGSVVVQVATAPPAGELAITAADIEAARRLLDQHQRTPRLALPEVG